MPGQYIYETLEREDTKLNATADDRVVALLVKNLSQHAWFHRPGGLVVVCARIERQENSAAEESIIHKITCLGAVCAIRRNR